MLREEVWTPANVEKLRSGGLRGKTAHDAATYPLPWTYKGAEHHLNKVTEAAGVECRGFHVFRHTRATALLAKGVPLNAVSQLLGHASVAVTAKIYDHTNALNFVDYID
jgi:integrase